MLFASIESGQQNRSLRSLAKEPEAAARHVALWSLRAVGRHEDPYGLAQKSPVFPGIGHLEL
jgi:hypothetical protein